MKHKKVFQFFRRGIRHGGVKREENMDINCSAGFGCNVLTPGEKKAGGTVFNKKDKWGGEVGQRGHWEGGQKKK